MAARRVLFVVTKLSKGGAMVVPLQVAAGLRKRGYVAETWFLYQHEPAFENEPGVRIIWPHQTRNLIDYLRIILRLIPAMRAFRPDAVHGAIPLGNIFGLLSAALIRCPSRVASQHSPAATHNIVMQWLDKIWGSIGIYTANIAVSYSVQESYKDYPRPYVNKLRVVQNGTRIRRPNRPKSAAREHFDLPRDARIIGSLGRLAHEKNQSFLFDVLAGLPDVHLTLAGDGDLHEELEQQARDMGLADRVHLLGAVPPEDVSDFLESLDIFVLPSRFEGLPMALIEAMQAGCPIIVSDIPSTHEVVSVKGGEAAGIILKTESPKPWIAAIRDLFGDAKKLNDLGETAKRRGDDFGLDRMVDGYVACLFPDSSPSRTRK
jgi:glycosyltransferase involved in cell wall biosynthesis